MFYLTFFAALYLISPLLSFFILQMCILNGVSLKYLKKCYVTYDFTKYFIVHKKNTDKFTVRPKQVKFCINELLRDVFSGTWSCHLHFSFISQQTAAVCIGVKKNKNDLCKSPCLIIICDVCSGGTRNPLHTG